MRSYSSYRLIEIDEDGTVWEILDEYAETTLMDLEKSEMNVVTVGSIPFTFNAPEITWQ